MEDEPLHCLIYSSEQFSEQVLLFLIHEWWNKPRLSLEWPETPAPRSSFKFHSSLEAVMQPGPWAQLAIKILVKFSQPLERQTVLLPFHRYNTETEHNFAQDSATGQQQSLCTYHHPQPPLPGSFQSWMSISSSGSISCSATPRDSDSDLDCDPGIQFYKALDDPESVIRKHQAPT